MNSVKFDVGQFGFPMLKKKLDVQENIYQTFKKFDVH